LTRLRKATEKHLGRQKQANTLVNCVVLRY
jgi:hypothetical protein